MDLESHCRECKEKLGKRYEEVHKWLDQFAFSAQYEMRHRRVLHHKAGIDEAGRLFGKGAAEAALLHVIADLKEEGWKEGVDRFPQDERDYLRMGLW
jgi:Domain of unknown function (DUF6915)